MHPSQASGLTRKTAGAMDFESKFSFYKSSLKISEHERLSEYLTAPLR